MTPQTTHQPRRAIHVSYFAILREQRGCSEETVQTEAGTAAELYDQLKDEHGFSLPHKALRVAINGEYCDWDAALEAQDEVVFIAPVGGG